MLCEICKKNEATVHITKIINGEKQEVNICDECAKRSEGFNISTPFSIQNVLNGIMDCIYQTGGIPNDVDPKCENCGTTFSEFKKSGLLGCNQCYKKFSKMLMPVIKRMQGNVEHVGKIPEKYGKSISEKKKIATLKEELQKAIALEEYEKAAEIRDTIRDIQKSK